MFAIYGIHIQWFYLIVRGVLKAFGVIKPQQRPPYTQIQDETNQDV